MSAAELWLLVMAGLSLKKSPSTPPKRALDLASPEMRRLQGWFDKFIREDDAGCWVWHGARFGSGYAAAGWQGTALCAHRLIYRWMVADVPRSLDLDHLCRNRACVNPEHLEPVTRSMNLTRGAHPTQGRLGRATP